jgi:DNA recombination protein RmuC
MLSGFVSTVHSSAVISFDIGMEIILLAVGLVVGVAGAWLAAKYRYASQQGRVEERAEMLAVNLRQKSDELRDEQDSVSNLKAELSGMRERLLFQKSELEELEKRFTEQFQNIATRIVNENSQLIQQQHKQKLEDVLGPFKERIQEFEKKVDSTREQGIKDSQSLKDHILHLQKLNEAISEDAKNLTSALTGQSKAQGDWGEIILERILEKSGLVQGREYTVQANLKNEEGRRRHPDVIINLPEKKNIVIDSKISLTAYERFCRAGEDAVRAAELKEHIASVRRHIKELGQKNYQSIYEINSPDFVFMFIPIEGAFNLAIQNDGSLYDEALERNIALLSTTSLWASLRIIASLWRQEYQNQNAIEIARQGGELYDKFVGFVDDLIELGHRMDAAKGNYQDAMAKLHTGRGNLVKRADDMKKLGAKANKALPQSLVDRIDTSEQMSLIE